METSFILSQLRGYVGATFARGSVVATLVIREFLTGRINITSKKVGIVTIARRMLRKFEALDNL